MPPYIISPISTRADLDALLDVTWAAWWDPYMPQLRITLPVFGNLNGDRERSIAASKERVWQEFQAPAFQLSPPAKQWICAKDSNGDVVGGFQLAIAEGSAFPNGVPKMQLPWWPEGEEVREFVEEMMAQVFTPRSMWMQRPHGGLLNTVVDPKHRGRGVGKMLMEYGCRELDERGIEGFVEASELGRPVYESAGYQVVMKVSSYIPAEKSIEWKKWYHEMGVAPWYAMWRPKNGKIVPGERTKPWQLGSEIPV